MSDGLRLLTAEEVARLDVATRYGLRCAACGGETGRGDALWIERFWVGTKLFHDPKTARSRIYRGGAVCTDCAPPELAVAMAEQEPTVCAGCGRAMYYRAPRDGHSRLTCSIRCREKAAYERRA
jgi:hypothetical protein